jgi:PAS domain S-box-containing protein
MQAEEILSLLMVPLVTGDQVIGLLELVEGQQERTFTTTEIRLCQTLANQAAAAMQNARLYDEAQRRNRELALLNRVIATSATSQDIASILETVCRELAQTLGLPKASAVLLNEAKTEVTVIAEHRHADQPPLLGVTIPLPEEYQPAYREYTTPLVIADTQVDWLPAAIRDVLRQRGIVSMLLVPLFIEGEVAGSLLLSAAEQRLFTAEEVDLARRVAGQLGGPLSRARLQETHQRLSTAVEQSPDSVLITDTAGTILYVNPAFERVTGYSRAEALGRTPRLLKSGQHDEAFYRELWTTISAGRVWQGRFINRKKDGSLYTEDATITPLRNPAGEVVQYVATMRDVTRELELEQQFRQAQKMEAVGRLAGGVAHDFNNLLTVIRLSARLLEDQLHRLDPLRSHVERIQEASQRAANLTRQLLAFSRKEIVEPKVLDLNQVLGELDKMLRRLIGEDVELILLSTRDLWPVKIDPTQVEQAVVNLAVNARDAMPRGGKLTIETANVVFDEAYAAHHLEVEPGEYTLLAVSDNGVGMNEEVKTHLFEPFFTTKERGKGTGLGLATVFGIVKQNGGHVRVYSEVGQGTTFKIYLPRVAENVPTPLRLPQPAAARGMETLLIVEDELPVRELTRDILLDHGYRVLAAGDGVEALRIAGEHEGPIHLLLTDVVMPRMSGRELANQLRDRRPETRVLFTSGYTDNAVVHHGVLVEGVHFLSKPFELEALVQKVREVLDTTH